MPDSSIASNAISAMLSLVGINGPRAPCNTIATSASLPGRASPRARLPNRMASRTGKRGVSRAMNASMAVRVAESRVFNEVFIGAFTTSGLAASLSQIVTNNAGSPRFTWNVRTTVASNACRRASVKEFAIAKKKGRVERPFVKLKQYDSYWRQLAGRYFGSTVVPAVVPQVQETLPAWVWGEKTKTALWIAVFDFAVL